MRRILLGFSALILLTALFAACGGSDSDSSDAPEPTSTTEASTAGEEASTEVGETEEAEATDEPTEASSEETEVEATEASTEATSSEAASDTGAEKELVWAAGVDINTLDGAFVVTLTADTLIDLIFQKLVKLTPDFTVEPELATSWEVSEDGLTWTFELVQDATFSNGNPVTADAVKYSLDRVRDEATAAPNRRTLAAISDVRVVDDYTVEIETDGPFPDLFRALAERAATILDPEVAQQFDNPADVGLHPVGSGPYQVVEWETGIGLTLERNPEYAGTPPPLDRIIYRAVPEAGTRMAMIQSGEADIISGPTLEDLEALDGNPEVDVLAARGILMVTFEILTDKAPLDNVLVRRALNYAIDRDAILNDLLQGYGTLRCSPVTPAVGPDFYTDQNCYDYDPEMAKQLLAEAGHADGFEIDMWCPIGRYLKDREICEAVQFYFSEVGVTANLETFEWATYTSLWADPDRTLWMIGRGAGFADAIFTQQLSKEHWDSGANNTTRFYDEEVEDLLVKARSSFDVEERAEYYAQIQEIVWEFAPFITLHSEDNLFAHRSNISGIEVIPNSVLVLGGVDKE